MKTILTILFSLIFTTISYADQITLINNGKPGGSSDARTKLYHAGLIDIGYDVKYENIGQITQAVEFFDSVEGPAMMVYVNMFANKQKIVHTSENYIALEYKQPLYFCSANDIDSLPREVTVAYGKSYNADTVANIIKATGRQATMIPYKNSSAVLEAILGGDVDISFTNQGKSLKFIKSGKGSCFGHTGDSRVIGVDPIKTNYNIDFELPIMMATVIAKNIDIAQLRQDVHQIMSMDDFVSWHKNQQLMTDRTLGWEEELRIVSESEKLWQ